MALTGNAYYDKVCLLKKSIPEWNSFFNRGDTHNENDELTAIQQEEMIRSCNWVRLDVLGKPLCKKYSWAIPDERALQILESFAPLIEIGAGKGYWARLLRDRGVDILAFDKYKYNCDSSTAFKSGSNNFSLPFLYSKPSFIIHSSSSIWKGSPRNFK